MPDSINVLNETYNFVDEISNIPIVDSFVRKNKIGRGNGEARLYLGSQDNKSYYEKFFNNYAEKDNCFFLKKDLEDYLNDSKFEYEVQEQGYQRDISSSWQHYSNETKEFPSKIDFSIDSANGVQDIHRYYIRSRNNIFYNFFRNIALPIITYLTIIKIESETGKNSYYFRPSLNYFYNPLYHPAKIKQEEKVIKEDLRLTESKKEQIILARLGQGKYREKLFDEINHCIITKVNDERILIASHIKPWSISNDKERLDPYNGIPFTPTYDKLFDQGFISFQDNGAILVSAHISPFNIKRLNLIPNHKYDIANLINRRHYLQYHRDNIFKK